MASRECCRPTTSPQQIEVTEFGLNMHCTRAELQWNGKRSGRGGKIGWTRTTPHLWDQRTILLGGRGGERTKL